MIEINESFPLYVSKNIDTLKTFYEQQFGFNAVYFDPEFYLHLLHPKSGTQIGFMLPDHPSQPDFLHPVSNRQGCVLSFDVTNARATYDLAVSSGLDIVLDYKEEAWGQNHFIIRDPEGFLVDMVEHVN